MSHVVSLIAGLMFGAGLTISGMINPAKILDFLDFTAIPEGGWDPSLALVFAAGLVPMFVAYAVQRRMIAPVAATQFQMPTNTIIDRRLLTGSALFGVGWGLAGLCPGPAITGLAFAQPESYIFVAAMFAGFLLNRLVPMTPMPNQESRVAT
ncbi:MAG: DUF6691 family protein [Hyphomicrobiaceae bacterium]